jgi:hypothetical protein
MAQDDVLAWSSALDSPAMLSITPSEQPGLDPVVLAGCVPAGDGVCLALGTPGRPAGAGAVVAGGLVPLGAVPPANVLQAAIVIGIRPTRPALAALFRTAVVFVFGDLVMFMN